MVLGEVIADRFELEAEAGTGAMGTVYRALDRASGMPVAVKVVDPAVLRTSLEAERFAREAELLAELSHPGIVRYLAHGVVATGARYLVTEWVEGVPLSRRLGTGPLGVATSVEVLRQAAEALGEAHQRGIIHRDLKPANLLLTPSGAVKLIDFGLARRVEGLSSTRTGTMLGSPGYMAPEQATGSKGVDSRADVFSLGCVLYECLTGRPAFTGHSLLAVIARILLDEPPSLAGLCPEAPEALCVLVAGMMAKAPGERPENGGVVAEALAALGARVSVPASRVAADTSQHLLLIAAEEAEPGPLEEEGLERRRAVLRRLEAPAEARVEVLAEGSVLAVLPAAGAGEAGRAAEYALSLRALFPEAAMVLACRRGAAVPRPGDSLEEAARELEAESMRLLFADMSSESSAPIFIDEETAARLPPEFELRATATGHHLTGRRRESASP